MFQLFKRGWIGGSRKRFDVFPGQADDLLFAASMKTERLDIG